MKQKLLLNQKPVFIHSVNSFVHSKIFDQIICVFPQGEESFFESEIRKINDNISIDLVAGGKERQNSILNALRFIENQFSIQSNDMVLIHDSARPFADENMIQDILSALKDYPAAAPGYKISDALKIVSDEGLIEKDVDRKSLWAVTTPQGFHLKTLFKLLSQETNLLYDETSLFMKQGYKVKLIETGRYNLKITYPEDFKIAEKLV